MNKTRPSYRAEMAAKHRKRSMADELLFNVSNIKYTSYCSYISECDAVEVNEFPQGALYLRYWLDTSICISEYERVNKPVKRVINKSVILDTFAQYSTYSTAELRKMIKKEVETNWAWYEELFGICLRMRMTPMKKWLHNQSLKSVPGDEMTIFVLSVIFRRHTIVYTKTRPWTTYAVTPNMSIEELHNQCETHLMYLGGGIFGIIHPRPYSIPTHRRVNLLITQQLTNVIRTIGKTSRELPLDLSVPRCRDISKFPNIEQQVVEASDETLAQISEQNRELYERRKFPLIDITDQETDTVTSDNHGYAITDSNIDGYEDLEYLMESSKTDPVLSFTVTPGSNTLPDVTSNSAVSKPIPNQIQETGHTDCVTPEPVNTDIMACTNIHTIVTSDKTTLYESNTDHDITQTNQQFDWIPNKVNQETKGCTIKLRKLSKIDLALWCHPTRKNHTAKQKLGLPDTDNKLPTPNTSVKATEDVTSVNTLEPTGVEQTMSSENNTQEQSAVNQKETSKDTTDCIKPPDSNPGLSSSEEFPEVNEKLKYVENSHHVSVDTVETILSNYSSPYRRRLRKAPLPRRLRTNGRKLRNVETVNYTDKSRLDSDSAPETQRKETNTRPGPSPSKNRITARTANKRKQLQTYSVVPIKKIEHTGDTTEIDSDVPDTPTTNTVTNTPAKETLNQSPPISPKHKTSPPVTSENELPDVNSLSEDDTPLSVLQTKLRDADKSVTSDNNTKLTKGTFKCKTVGIPSHRKADRVCPICKIAKTSNDSLRDHINRRHSNLKCRICSKQFITDVTLRKHKYTHMTASWKCSDCPQSFFFQSELITHRIKHETDKKYKCIYKNCDREFSYSWDYNTHLEEHKNPPRECPAPGCDFTTKSKRDMKQHSRIHTDELPYKCKQCGKGFRFTMQRKRHVNSSECPANLKK